MVQYIKKDGVTILITFAISFTRIFLLCHFVFGSCLIFNSSVWAMANGSAALLNYVRNCKSNFACLNFVGICLSISQACDARSDYVIQMKTQIVPPPELKEFKLTTKSLESGNTTSALLTSSWQFPQPATQRKNIKFARILRSLSHLAFMFCVSLRFT